MSVLSMSELTTFRWSFEEDVAHFKRAGYEAVGVWRQKLTEFGEEKGIDLLEESGLRVSNLLWCGGFTGSDGRSFRDGLEDARDAIQTAAHMRAGCLVVYTGARGGHTHNHARRLLKEALKELLPLAAEQGVTLALEPMHAEVTSECTFLNDLNDALALIESLNHPRLKLAFHTYHMGLCPAWKTNLAAVAPHIAVVHLGDGHPPQGGEQVRTKLGDGVVPLAEIVAALGMAGFNGYYDVELIGTDVEPSGYLDLLDHSREAFGKLMT